MKLLMFACLIVCRKVSLFFAGRKGSRPLKNRAGGFFLVRQNCKNLSEKSSEKGQRKVTVVGFKSRKNSQGKSVGCWAVVTHQEKFFLESFLHQ